jgi:RNA 3'-terminal phosphate cyclase (ATP)
MIEIDGSTGEGGGQMLRTSLSLSMATGQPFRIVNLRANRKKPGLKRQHLTAVRAAAEICGATVQGDELGSREVAFEPGPVQPGHYPRSSTTLPATCARAG